VICIDLLTAFKALKLQGLAIERSSDGSTYLFSVVDRRKTPSIVSTQLTMLCRSCMERILVKDDVCDGEDLLDALETVWTSYRPASCAALFHRIAAVPDFNMAVIFHVKCDATMPPRCFAPRKPKCTAVCRQSIKFSQLQQRPQIASD
jgi:hypothetical protein